MKSPADAKAKRTAFGALLLLLVVATGLRSLGAEAEGSPSDPDDAAGVSNAEELDRPGDVENPFALPPGTTQAVGYVLALNPEAREDEDFGSGGGATVLQTGARFGIAPGWEGQVFADTFLNASDRVPDDDAAGASTAGLGFATLRAKASVWTSAGGDAGLALVPFVRFAVNRTLDGRTGAEPGLVLPFDFDLGRGWEIQGSTGITDAFADDGGRTAEWETESSLEWNFAPHWSVYVEPEFEVDEGRANWAMEEGLTIAITRHWQLDAGFHSGLGEDSDLRFAYAGVGWTF